MAGLTDRKVQTAGPGTYSDGSGLYLVVSETKARKWVFRYQLAGKRRLMGLGSYPAVSLASARLDAATAREKVARGVDPIDARKEEKEREAAVEAAPFLIPTFKEIAADVIVQAKSETKNAKVQYQWERHLGPAYCGKLLDRRVDEIKTVDVASVLEPVWQTKPEVARKLLPAIRRVFERARIILRDRHHIVIDNPARWDDLKAMGFKAPAQLTVGRHPSLPYRQMPEFIKALRQVNGMAARMLEFVILTNVRGGTARMADWSEFDTKAALWTVPPDHLKDGAHRDDPFEIPLSDRAVKILEEVRTTHDYEIIFATPGGESKSDMAMTSVIQKMHKANPIWIDPRRNNRRAVPHGFRATFRTWAEEVAAVPHAVTEQAMGHVVGTEVERAYRRTELLDKRRELMAAWAEWCEPKG